VSSKESIQKKLKEIKRLNEQKEDSGEKPHDKNSYTFSSGTNLK